MIKMHHHFNIASVAKRTAAPAMLLLLSGCATIQSNEACMEWQENKIPTNPLLTLEARTSRQLSQPCISGRAAARITASGAQGGNQVSPLGHEFAKSYLGILDQQTQQQLEERRQQEQDALLSGDASQDVPTGPTDAQKARMYYEAYLKRHGLTLDTVTTAPAPVAPPAQHPQAAQPPAAPPNCVVSGTNAQGQATFDCK